MQNMHFDICMFRKVWNSRGLIAVTKTRSNCRGTNRTFYQTLGYTTDSLTIFRFGVQSITPIGIDFSWVFEVEAKAPITKSQSYVTWTQNKNFLYHCALELIEFSQKKVFNCNISNLISFIISYTNILNKSR